MPTRPYPARSTRAHDAATDVVGTVAGSGPAGAAVKRETGSVGTGSALPARGRIAVQGFVERITLAPALATPSFEVLVRVQWQGTLQDVRVLWMGRRRVPGIEAGIGLRFEGMVTPVDGRPTVYNPRYEIIGRPEEY